MNLFEREYFDTMLATWPGVTFVDQWESHVAKVGNKVFAVLGDRLAIKCSEESFDILTSLQGITQAPYFAKRKWISISEQSPLQPEELEHYLQRSYDLVAKGLTKKLRTELGISLE